MNCKERNYELILEITAYPDNAVSFTSPMQVPCKYLEDGDVTLNEDLGFNIPMARQTGKLKETEKVELGGKSYTVSLTWDIDNPDKSTYEKLEKLQKTFNHLKVKTFGGDLLFIRAMDDGYRFTYEEDSGTIKCSLSVININGAQRIM